MKRFLTICFLLSTILDIRAQTPSGVYMPINHFSLRRLIFGSIPSYSYLSFKNDSTYYWEEFSGCFYTKQETGYWRTFNDTLMLYKPAEKYNGKFIESEVSSIKTDSLKDKLRFEIRYSSEQGIKDLKVVLYSDSITKNYFTDENGIVILKFIKFDSVTFKGDNHFIYPIRRITQDIHNQNDYFIDINQTEFLFKRNKLYTLKGRVVAKRR